MRKGRRGWPPLLLPLAALAPRRAYAGEIQSIMNSWFREIAVYVGSGILIIVTIGVIRRLARRWRRDGADRHA